MSQHPFISRLSLPMRPRSNTPVTVTATDAGDTTVLTVPAGYEAWITRYVVTNSHADGNTVSFKFSNYTGVDTMYLKQGCTAMPNLTQCEIRVTEGVFAVTLGGAGSVTVTLHYVMVEV
jgi:hypothetical protein